MSISRSKAKVVYALLPLQKGMLYHLFADPRSGVDVCQTVGTVPERLNFEMLERALQKVLDRHEALRTSFRWEPGTEPVQEVSSSAGGVVSRKDWRTLSTAQQKTRLAAFLADDRQQEIILTRCPVWRISVLECGEEEWRFVFTGPVALIDGHSLTLVVEEIFQFYDTLRAGTELALPEPRQFSEFVSWVRSRDMAAAQVFWQDKFQGYPGLPDLQIPAPDAPANARTEDSSEAMVRLEAPLVKGLWALAKATRVTPSILVKAAWSVLLSRLSSADDITFGEVHWGRQATVEDASSIVGLCINTLPIRVRLDPEMTVERLLGVLRKEQQSTRPFEHSALQDIQRWSGGRPGSPLFETLVVFNHMDFESVLQGKGGRMETLRFSNHERTSVPMTLLAHASPEFELKIVHDPQRFSHPFVRRMADYLQCILEGFVDNAQQPVMRLPMLPETERQKLLEEWNRTSRDMDLDVSVATLFDVQASRTPDRIALRCDEHTQTYAQLADRVATLACRLCRAGVQVGSLVGIYLDRSESMVTCLLATMKAGGAYVPLDPGYPIKRTRLVIEDACPAVILTLARYAGRFSETACRLIILDEADIKNSDGETPSCPAPHVTGKDLAYVIHTSGSTGTPKGVMLTHRNVVNCFVGMDDVLGEVKEGVWLAVTSIAFDISVVELLYTLTRGFTVVLGSPPSAAVVRSEIGLSAGVREAAGRLSPPGELDSAASSIRLSPVDELEPGAKRVRLSPPEEPQPEKASSQEETADSRTGELSELGRLIQRHAVTHLQCTPSLAKLMLIDVESREALKHLHCLLLGGEAFSESLREELGQVPGRTILNMYGPTETTIWSTVAAVDCSNGPVPIGSPIVNTVLHVVGPDMTLAPTGIPGELLIGGEGVARGYLNKPEVTSERFILDPFSSDPDARLYRTGDLVRYREDGVLLYLGRLDQQVKIRGHRIELGEIESALLRVAGVRDAVVLAREAAGGNAHLVGYVILDSESPPPVRELRRKLAEQLPAVMIPRVFVKLERFPMTPNGKVDRRAFPAPRHDPSTVKTVHVSPRKPLEEQLRVIWSKALGVERVGVRDNFFELGGDSVSLVQVQQGIRQQRQADLPLQALFQYPTIADLAAFLSAPTASTGNAWLTVDRYNPNTSGPPLVAIHGVENIFAGLVPHLPPDRPVVVLTTRAGFDGRVPPYSPCRTVEDMAEHYLDELRKIQPVGPYHLLGFCLGGLIAFEIARRLDDAGEEVAFVGLINSLPAATTVNGAAVARFHPRSWFVELQSGVGYLTKRIGEMALKGLREPSRIPARAGNLIVPRTYPWLIRCGVKVQPEVILRQIGQFGWMMIRAYSPQPYGGKVWLFGGTHAPPDSLDRWSRLVRGGLEAYQFGGDHYGLMSEPHVYDLADQVEECLLNLSVEAGAVDASEPARTHDYSTHPTV